jgi:hypothetical protein
MFVTIHLKGAKEKMLPRNKHLQTAPFITARLKLPGKINHFGNFLRSQRSIAVLHIFVTWAVIGKPSRIQLGSLKQQHR